MIRNAAHIHTWETAETVLGIPLLLSFLLGWLIPLPLSRWVPREVSLIAGAVFLLGGLVMIAQTRSQFRQASQPTDPGNPTTQIITTGIFAWSRNPLYLSGMVAFTGIALLLNSLWLLMLLILTIPALHMVLIAPEERYLEAKFGEPYRQYCQSVRRWFGRRR